MVLVMLMFCLTGLYAQNVTGQLLDETGAPVIGATIMVEGTSTGTVSDIDGNFSVNANPGDVLIIKYLGYADQSITVDNSGTISLSLAPDNELLDEVVVIGYGQQKKSHLTGAISKVENEKLDQISAARVDDALVGQVSGVNIQATSAEAGAAPTITIRGVGSINADSGPAVVVDGLVVDRDFLGNLDMNDIESFEVLKDAASAAIYGSEGSNGVIMITTKSGETGKTRFSYETYVGRKNAHESEGYKKSVADWAALELAETGEKSERTQYMELLVNTLGVDRDWQDVFFDGGNINSHSFSARGGSEKTKFSTSLRYLHDEGIVITDDYKLYSVKLKMNTDLTKRLKLGISATPSYSNRRALPTSIHNPIRQSPWLPIYHTEESLQFINRDNYPDVGVGDYFLENHLVELDLDGDGSDTRPRTSGDMNPYAQYVEREHYEYKTNLLGSAYLSYKIMDGLTAKASVGTTLEQRKRTRWNGTKHHSQATRASYELQNRFRTRLINDNTLDYQKDFGNHAFGALVGATFQRRQAENSVVSGTGYANDLLKNLQGATSISEFEETNVEKNKIGYFGRINYAFANKYLINASMRRDASSVFGVDSKWGNFPAISVGWNAHNESFFNEGNGLLSRLKFRVSYGLTGNENFNVGDDIINNYPYLALLNSSNSVTGGAISTGVSPRNIVNTLLQWEASKEFNPGLDFGLFNNRIMGSIDYYQRTSDKLLLENPVSYVTGFDAGIVNLGEVANNGWEGELRTRNIASRNFKWSTTLIGSTNKNELISFGESDGQLTEDGFGRNSEWINSVGNPISSFYGYVVDEEATATFIATEDAWDTPYFPINSVSEDAIVKDLNGDGLISEEDKAIIGDPYPDLIWSVTDQYFGTHWQGDTNDAAQLVEDGLIPHTSFLQARVLTNDVVQPAGYFSLRNVNIGYNLKGERLSRNGFNPEYIDNNNSPTAYGSQRAGTPLFRTISIGANVNF